MFQGSGNIPPILAIARRLVTRGHHVRIIAGPGLQPDQPPRPVTVRFLDEIKTAGATHVPFQQTYDPFGCAPLRRGLIGGWTPKKFAVHQFEARRILAAPLWAQNVSNELRRHAADVVVSDYFLFGALAAAEAAICPAVALVHTIYSRPIAGVPPYGPGLLPGRGLRSSVRDAIDRALIRQVHRREGLPPLNRARLDLGLKPVRSVFLQYDRAARVLIMTSAAFDFTRSSLPSNVRYTGMPFEEEHGVWKPPWPTDDGRPLVLVSFSTAPQGQATVLRRTLDALGPLNVRAVVTLGPALMDNEFRAPINVVLVPFVPHALILPHVDVVVSQCGHGTVLKALTYGVPLVCIPLRGDQPDIAARVVHADAGVALSPTASVFELRTAIERVLSDSSFRDAAERMATILRSEDGVQTAVAEIENVAAESAVSHFHGGA